LRKSLQILLREAALELRGERSGVALQLRTNLYRVRFNLHRVLLERGRRLATQILELFLSQLPSAAGEIRRGRLPGLRHLLARTFGGVMGVFFHLVPRVFT